MKTLSLCCLMFLCAVVCASGSAFAQGTGSGRGQGETITGTLIGIGGPLAGRSTQFTLTINGTTSDADVRRDIGILAEKGQDGLMNAIKDRKLGTFAVTGQLGRDVNAVRIRPTENGGRRIVILFERWVNLFEVRYGTRSQDYPFTYAEIFLDAQGKGEGTLIPAARIRFEKNNQTVEIENFGIYPARLAGVQAK